jgi:hypothetical protein
MKEAADIVAFIANVLTSVASGIAVYLFITKREYISSIFKVLMSYSTQLTLSELREKLDDLNDLHCPADVDEVVNVLHDISGQLRGNPRLEPHFRVLVDRIERATAGKGRLSEPQKRSVVSEIRERVRHVGVVIIDDMSGDHQ